MELLWLPATEELLSTCGAENGTSLAGRHELLAEAISCTDVLSTVCRFQQVVLFWLVKMKCHIMGSLVPDLKLFPHMRHRRDWGIQPHVLHFCLYALYCSFNWQGLSSETGRILMLLVKFGNVSAESVSDILPSAWKFSCGAITMYCVLIIMFGAIMMHWVKDPPSLASQCWEVAQCRRH